MDFILEVSLKSPKFCYNLKKSLEVSIHNKEEHGRVQIMEWNKVQFKQKCETLLKLILDNLSKVQRTFMENQDTLLNQLGKVSADLLRIKKDPESTKEIVEEKLKNMLTKVNLELFENGKNFYLPTNYDYLIKEIIPKNAKALQSAAKAPI